MASRNFNALAVTGAGAREVEVTLEAPNATAGDLLRALGTEAPNLVVDGTTIVPGDHELAEVDIRGGSVLGGTHQSGRPPVAAPPLVVAQVTGGPDSGLNVELGAGTAVIGRDRNCDVVIPSDAVSAVHAEILVGDDGSVTVADRASRNGTWVDDVQVTSPTLVPPTSTVRIGNAELVFIAPVDDEPRLDRRTSLHAAAIPFNRPPRRALPTAGPDIEAPEPPKPKTGPSPIGIIAIIGPIIMAGVMVVVLGSMRYAIFGLLSPVMAIGNYFDTKRRNKKGTRKESAEFDQALIDLEAKIRQRVAVDRTVTHAMWPDPAEIVRRAMLPSTTLWERRADAEDFLRLRVATGTVPWQPPLGDEPREGWHEDIEAFIDRFNMMPRGALTVDLGDERALGLVGDRASALATARSLVCQAAVLSGPADLIIAVFTRSDEMRTWDWAKWLPHTTDPDLGTTYMAASPESTANVVGRLANVERDVTVLAVVDDLDLLQGRRSPLRSLLQGQYGKIAGIVISPTDDRLPAVVSDELHLHDDLGQASLITDERTTRIDALLASGMSDLTARTCARSLARFEDPELAVVAADLPDVSRLIPLLDIPAITPDAIADRWKANGPHPPPRGPLGVTGDDVFSIDMVRDGPHGLVGGTTGSGKSELLRSMVAGMAASADPDHLTFVLVDFKGGSAFEACSRLPHTVGMVTDLDAHLAQRALRCLEAELRYREEVFHDAGAPDLPEYLRQGHGDRLPVPRLMVVIDEFATLKEEHPDFMDALVGIAQRGRSLGVHMILATQRPSGAVNENIKANTNLRIALRVQDQGDSNDVIGTPDAAKIPRGRHGRAFIRLGPGEVVPIQSAWSMAPPQEDDAAPVTVKAFGFGASDGPAQAMEQGDVTELDLLVEAITGAFDASGAATPRKPWPDPLPAVIDLDLLIAGDGTALDRPETSFRPSEADVIIALADDPDRQRQIPVGWTPEDGNLLIYGIVGSGTTTALMTTVLAAARRRGPDDMHLYVLDMGTEELAPLAALPHTGAYVTSQEAERRMRLIRFLHSEISRRRRLGPALRDEPEITVVIDSYSALMAEFDEVKERATIDSLEQTIVGGPEVKIRFLITADRSGAIRSTITSTVRQRLAMRLADASGYPALGIKVRNMPTLEPGRCFHSESGLFAHIGSVPDPAAECEALTARWGTPTRPPGRIETLASDIAIPVGAPEANLTERPWRLALGTSETTLGPAEIEVYPGEHFMAAGPARSGRTTTLVTLATRAAQAGARVVAIESIRSPITGRMTFDAVVSMEDLGPETLFDGDRPTVLVIDDADAIDKADQLTPMLQDPRLLVAASGRNSALRKGFSHWTRDLRDSRLGMLLQPDVDLDGDLCGTKLPRKSPVEMVPGRGYLVVSAEPSLVQVWRP